MYIYIEVVMAALEGILWIPHVDLEEMKNARCEIVRRIVNFIYRAKHRKTLFFPRIQ